MEEIRSYKPISSHAVSWKKRLLTYFLYQKYNKLHVSVLWINSKMNQSTLKTDWSGFKPFPGTPLSTQEFKWVWANCWGNLTNCGGMTCNGLASCPGGVEILLAASCYRRGGRGNAGRGPPTQNNAHCKCHHCDGC